MNESVPLSPEDEIVHLYRKKPVVIEAIRWTGGNWPAVCEFLGVPENGYGDMEEMGRVQDGWRFMPILIHTLEGDMHAVIGDYIIKGVKGEFYPCKPDIFQASYGPAESVPNS